MRAIPSSMFIACICLIVGDMHAGGWQLAIKGPIDFALAVYWVAQGALIPIACLAGRLYGHAYALGKRIA